MHDIEFEFTLFIKDLSGLIKAFSHLIRFNAKRIRIECALEHFTLRRCNAH